MKRFLALLVIVAALILTVPSLSTNKPSVGGNAVAYAGHVGAGGAYCPGVCYHYSCNVCGTSCLQGFNGLTRRDQGKDAGEVKVSEPIGLPGRLALAVLRLVLVRSF